MEFYELKDFLKPLNILIQLCTKQMKLSIIQSQNTVIV